MATVTFPIELGGSGLVVSDDTDPTTGLRNGGYLTRFVPALQQTVAVAGFVVGQVSNAAASASAAAGSASAASSSESSAASSAASAATLYDQFDDRYLGPKASNPTVDNDGNALLVGAMYFNTAALETRVWNGTTWQTASVNGGTVNSLIVTGALQYQGTLTGGTGVINIGSGQLVKDTAGNLGLGVTPSAWLSTIKALQITSGFAVSGRVNDVTNAEISANQFVNASGIRSYLGAGAATLYQQASGAHLWFVAPLGAAGNQAPFVQAMVVTNNGDLLVGTGSSNGYRILVANATTGLMQQWSGSTGNVKIKNDQSNIVDIFAGSGDALALGVGDAEKIRVSSQGYTKISDNGSYGGVAGVGSLAASTNHVIQASANVGTLLTINGDLGSAVRNYDSYLATGAAGFHYQARLNNVIVYQVLASGSVQNATNSYGAISDPKLKDIIGPKSSTWEKTKQYNWIEYYLKSDTEHTFKMLGLNAEEAAAISPGVVDESPDLVEVTKVRQVPVQIVRLDENENPTVDEESGEVLYDEVMVDEEYTEWEPNGEFTKSVKYSVVSMQYHRTTQECQQRIESLEAAKVQADDLIQQIMARVAALESASA